MTPNLDTAAGTTGRESDGTAAAPDEKRTVAAPSTEERLLDTAERMFGELGVEAVSIRTITTAAEANVAAAHYYFRSKEGLVKAIFARRMGEISNRRSELLDVLEARDAVSPRDIATAMVVPLAELLADPTDERRHYLGFLSSTLATRGPLRRLALESFDPQLHRFDDLLARALPDITRPVRLSRFMIVVEAAIRQLADLEWASLPWSGIGDTVDTDELVHHLTDALAGTLMGSERGRALPEAPPEAPAGVAGGRDGKRP